MTTITEEIAELQAMPVPELVARYGQVFGKPPRVRHRAFLWKRIAWKLQEQRFGGLSKVARRRLDELIAEIDLPLPDRDETVVGKVHRRNGAAGPKPGTTLVRTWKGQEIRVQVLDRGFECDGVVFRSLSAVAKAVTGSHWNGRLFFGLTTRRKAQ